VAAAHRGGMPQVTQEALLVFVESDANSNKFYRLRLHDDGSVHKLWGRVRKGDALTGQSQIEHGGQRKFDSILAAKQKKGYAKVDVVETTTAKTASTSELHLTAAESLAGGSTDRVVMGLVDRLVAANKHNLMSSTGGAITVDVSGQARTALGVISARAVTDARVLLDQMVTASDDAVRGRLTEQYLRIVPHDIPVSYGRGWAPRWLSEFTSATAQRDLLDALAASASYADAARRSAAETKAGEVDKNFFRYRVHRLDETTEEYKAVVDRFHATKQAVHGKAYGMTPKYVYRLEDRRHEADIRATAERVRNVQRLWHGTGAANVLSILQKGLFVPPTTGSGIHIAGRMFGDGIYLSKSATKSLNYSTGHWGGGHSPSTFMFLTQAAMGYEYRPNMPSRQIFGFKRPAADSKGKRYDSVNALPELIPGLRNHEAVIADPMQVNLSWLIEF
jgi:poly [ADP-ribose] polymerase